MCKQISADYCQKIKDKYGAKGVDLEDQTKNKIVIDIDGNSYSERFQMILSTGSAVIKIAAFLDIAFVPAKPWIHYIPVKMDLSDLEEKIKWAK